MLPFLRPFPVSRASQHKSGHRPLGVQLLEDRRVLSSLSVVNLNDSGAGSLRQALLTANAAPGADTINFQVAGTIHLTSGALPAITSPVTIDGTSAPGYSAAPVVEIDFNHFAGLQLSAGSGGSTVRALAIDNALSAGITLNSSGDTIAGNYIGLGLDGSTVAANGGDGVALVGSSMDTIGGTGAHDGNIISGNSGNGIFLSGAAKNQIQGNYIGTDATGTLARGNAQNGILLSTASPTNVIGGSATNVISSNGANGIEFSGASGNQVMTDNIGTDVTGTVALGNAQNGILITAGAAQNTIGGTATGGNDPTGGTFVRPPQGNLISGNQANGVLINGGATQNTLSGNYIGTTATGSTALGNTLDGVAIVGANNNSLLGCTIQTQPFVFYNVISGNGGNGIRVTNSNGTTIQANFIGIGADNQTALGNALNGVLVEGTSANTTMGGPIPLGNVDAANGENGILVQGTASFFTSYNTFCGLAAFQTYTYLGNHGDGMLITSTGGNILIRTNVVTENGNDGIEIGGAASGVRVAGNIVGLDTSGNGAMGNVKNGIEVDGTAHDDIIGGPQATFNIIPQNAISANGANGVAITSGAHNILVNHSYIGTDLTGSMLGTGGTGEDDFGNAQDGIYVGPGTYGNTIGATDSSLLTIISGNQGDGVALSGTHDNRIIGSYIGTDVTGAVALGNVGNGVSITNSSNNVIGNAGVVGVRSLLTPTSSTANIIANSGGDGVLVASGSGNSIRDNAIHDNALLGIMLDSGANQNQAAPVLAPVQTLASSIKVSGTLQSTANTTFLIDFYASSSSNASGKTLLGVIGVTTNALGLATFTFASPKPPTGSPFITATATSSSGNTSEFSAAVS